MVNPICGLASNTNKCLQAIVYLHGVYGDIHKACQTSGSTKKMTWKRSKSILVCFCGVPKYGSKNNNLPRSAADKVHK